jgi:hypothetical protein
VAGGSHRESNKQAWLVDFTVGAKSERAGGFHCKNTYQARRVDLTAQSHGRGRTKNKEWVI